MTLESFLRFSHTVKLLKFHPGPPLVRFPSGKHYLNLEVNDSEMIPSSLFSSDLYGELGLNAN